MIIIFLVLTNLFSAKIIYDYQLDNSSLKEEIKIKNDIISSSQKDLELCNQKHKIRDEEIMKFKEDSLQKENEIHKLVAQLANTQIELEKSIQDNWEQKEFTNNCEQNIEILKNHALELKGKKK